APPTPREGASGATAASPAACCEGVALPLAGVVRRGAPGGRALPPGDASLERLPLRPERRARDRRESRGAGKGRTGGFGRHLLRRRHGAEGQVDRAAAALHPAGRIVARAAAGRDGAGRVLL